MKTETHTPTLKWYVQKATAYEHSDGSPSTYYAIMANISGLPDGSNETVTILDYAYFTDEELANKIVRAVNRDKLFEEMLYALKESATRWHHEAQHRGYMRECTRPTCLNAVEIIAKAISK